MPVFTAVRHRGRTEPSEPSKPTVCTIVVLAAVLSLVGVTLSLRWASVAAVVVVGGMIAWRDVRTRTIPNRWVVTLATAGIALSLSSAVVRHHPAMLLTTVFAAAAAFAGYFVFGLLGWVGFGDAKLATALALVTSVAVGASSMLLLPCAVLLGGAQRILFARLVQRTHQPHGPALVIAALILLSTADLLR